MSHVYEAIAFPDVEDLLVNWLNEEYDERNVTARAHTQVPRDRPDEFTLVPRVGGIQSSLVVDVPQIAVECWGNTPKQAADLGKLTRALFGSLRGRVLDGYQIYRVQEIGGLANLPDSRSDQSRYTFLTSVSIRGKAI